MWASLDHESIRRGYQVYKQVCSACHGMEFVSFRELVDVCMTKKEAKAEAEATMIHYYHVENNPNNGDHYEPTDEGEVPEPRPGTLPDYFPDPYPNKKAAAYANNGAIPPDLTLMAPARHGGFKYNGEDYIFHLLTGYADPPAGLELKEGQYFNPYMQGHVIGMAPPLYNEIIEYEDGTPATKSQLAKDVCTFIVWAGQPEFDAKKRIGMNVMVFTTAVFLLSMLKYRNVWAPLKSKKMFFDTKRTYWKVIGMPTWSERK